MSAAPKVSVVIPVYNTETYLDEAIGCITSQTLADIEILAVDDGSTDGSLAVLERIAAADARVKVFTQPNAGQSVARNVALGHARGEYVYFMDSDDRLDADAFELCYAKCREESLDFVIFDADAFCEVEGFDLQATNYDRAGKIADRVYTGLDILDELMAVGGYSVSPCLSLVSRSYLDERNIRFYPGIIHEDELYSAQLYVPARRVGRIDRKFFHRRYRASSVMTSVYSKRTIKGYMTVMRELAAFRRRTSSPRAKAMIRTLMRRMLAAVMYNASTMPAADRRGLLLRAAGYPCLLSAKSTLVLALPCLRNRGKD